VTTRKLPWWKRAILKLAKRAVVGLEGIGGASSGFAGARWTRLLLDWVMINLSADREIQTDLPALRARARELVRNNAYAKRFLQLLRANVVGPHGIRLQTRIRSAEGRPFDSVNVAIEDAWAAWGKVGVCTVDGKYSWRDAQGLIATTLGQDGEFLIRLVRGFPNDFGFALQFIDADLLDVAYNRPAGDGVNEIRMGIEIDAWGRPVQFWLWKRHPSESGRDQERKPVAAADIIHGFVPLRVSQTRGVPWFHPVLVDHKMLGGYQEAELVASRSAAAKPVYYTVDPEKAGQTTSLDETVDTVPEEVSPGLAHELPPGYDVKAFDPTHPNAAYKDFVSGILRSISAGLGVSYHSLANDLSGVNYSSARVGELADRDEWRSLQQWMVEHVHERIYTEWLKMALLAGELPGLSLDHRNYLRVAWRPRGWAWVDPRNELDASEKELELGLNSRTRQAAEQGRDFEEILEDLKEEKQLMVEHGLELGPVPGGPGRVKQDGTATDGTTDGTDNANGNGNGNGNRIGALTSHG
jgi:lambda family phage portal protein